MHCANMWQIYSIGFLYFTTLIHAEQPRIIIIGAGASGIAAASKLFENGFDNITILEAEERIGGRVYTTWFDESWVDLGGQWVQGHINNTVFELASPFGLLEVPENDDNKCIVFTSQGDRIPSSITDQVFESFFASGTPDDFIGNNGSVGEYYKRVMKTEFEKYPMINETLASELMTLFETITAGTNSADNWDELSIRGFVEYQIPPGSSLQVNWKDRGYGTILDVLMKKYPNPEEELPVLNNTLLGSEVVNINYNSIDGKALVKTSDGKEYLADHVITTMSLGVLKAQHESLFTPQLPEARVRTIQNLGFGTIAKIYLSFEEPWWPAETPSFSFIWDQNDRQEYENDLDKKWLLGLNDFSTVDHKPRLLCGWMFGASARYMENLSEDQVFNQTVALLDKFLGKSFNITRPTGMLRTQWHNQKHFRGTYSFRSMETERNDVWAAELAVPLLNVDGKPIVMFAGEATNPHHFGTVDGAVETGFREANRLVDLYKKKSE